MLEIKEEELKKILPTDGPSINEVKKYLEKYNDEYIVIKCGGSVLVNQDLFNNFINDISVLNKLGFIPIIIHGGGKRISIKLNEAGIKSNFIDGLRVTDKKSIIIVEEVLNIFNKEITDALKNNRQNIQAIALAKTQDLNILNDWDKCAEICSEYVNGGLGILEDLRNKHPQDSDFITQIVELMRRQALKNRKNNKD